MKPGVLEALANYAFKIAYYALKQCSKLSLLCLKLCSAN